MALPLSAQVEVTEEKGGAPSWKPAEVRAHLGRSRFSVCIDRDEEFIEVYGLGEEGTEWRRGTGSP